MTSRLSSSVSMDVTLAAMGMTMRGNQTLRIRSPRSTIEFIATDVESAKYDHSTIPRSK